MEHMWKQFEKLKLRQQGQLELPFQFDNNGHTIAEEERVEEQSSFNKSLKTALEFNPNKDKK